MVAAAFPLAQVAINAAEKRAAEATGPRDGDGSTPGVGELPFIPRGGSTTDPSGDPDAAGAVGGSSSRPDAAHASQTRAGASGSPLLDQVLGAAELMGYDVAVPELPTTKIASDQPLRAAILAWIAATGSVVPADELTVQLLRADALPLEIQRDVALLLLATIEASVLQRAALAALTPAELEWVYTNPEVAELLVQGVETPETRRMAILAAKVDMKQSLAATLLMLKAVETTAPTFEQHAAKEQLALLDDAQLDPTTRALLALLAGGTAAMSDSEKVRFAARLVALGAGISVPEALPAPSFPDALQALLAATGGEPAPAELDAVLARAALLPLDLQDAVARLVLAQARAVDAANPAYFTPTSQPEALVAVLMAVADGLPTFQKYNLYWRGAPGAIRVSEWDSGMRAGWAAHHTALATTAAGDLVDATRASALMAGHRLPEAPAVPSLSFVDAFALLATADGATVDADMRRAVADAAAALDPTVHEAATLLLAGAAESARLHEIAYAKLDAEERFFLATQLEGLDALYGETLAPADLARLARARALAERVDTDALLASRLVAVRATQDAHRLLEGADAFGVQGEATRVKTGLWDALKRLVPFGSARAQAPATCGGVGLGIVDTCGEDVVLRVYYPAFFFGGTPPGEAFSNRMYCDERECVTHFTGAGNREMLVIYGTEGTTRVPESATRTICNSVEGQGFSGMSTPVFSTGSSSTMYTPGDQCRMESVPRYGAPTVTLDLGGSDRYLRPVAMVQLNATIPVSLHLEAGQDNDFFMDPSPLYDRHTPLLRFIGANNGHPTQASAMFGGVAVLLDAGGNDVYEAATRSQAYGRTGFALLADLGGTDAYTGTFLVQGAATETLTLGGAVLLDLEGADRYTAITGQGYGLGSILLDAGGSDTYTNEAPPLGMPVARFEIIPGGDVTTLDERDDNRFWIDGPGSINIGLGIDTEVPLAGGNADFDGDLFPDFVEIAVGTDPFDRRSTPLTDPAGRANLVLDDSDGDGWPDYLERLFSTDPDAESGAESYPAGLPTGLRIVIPPAVYGPTDGLTDGFVTDDQGRVNVDEAAGADETAPGFRGSGKILDLRLPLQDAGSLTYACTGPMYVNQSVPLSLGGFLGRPTNVAQNTPLAPAENAPGSGQTRDTCVYVSYDTSAPGQGNATAPNSDRTTGRATFDFKLPVGIVAIGDVIPTRYREDYFVVIDLGGADNFTGSPGGGLVVKTTPTGTTDRTGTNAFVAPSLVLNVDVVVPAPVGSVLDAAARDEYYNLTRDFSQGSYFGVLVDTAGDDKYAARNVSQGALGGVLLDLGGSDTYVADSLSQGAGLAGAPLEPDRPRAGMPMNGNFTADRAAGETLPSAQRRLLPGLLVDFAAGSASTNSFRAGNFSQGFAQGFLGGDTLSPRDNATRVHGILATLGSKDFYTATAGSRFMQGVGGPDGVGLLFDHGGNDTYTARGPISQGAAMSQFIATGDPRTDNRPHPAAGVLVDVSDSSGDAHDRYAHVTGGRETVRGDRNQATTIQRHEDAVTSASGPEPRSYLSHGIHIDTVVDPSDPEAFLAGIGGAGYKLAGDDANTQFHVHLPSARLAIGNEGLTGYDREYAFAVDLGGRNWYNYSAAGHIRDYLAARTADPAARTANLASGQHETPLNLFPVTFLLDAGQDRSEYRLTGNLGQGAGLFGVGVLADLGGRDSFVAAGPRVPALGAAWMNGTPSIDGNIGPEWDEVPAKVIELVAARDDRFATPWTVRVANNERALFVAINGTTMTRGNDRVDSLTINLDPGRRLLGFDAVNNRTGIDQVVLSFAGNACRTSGVDRHYTASGGFAVDTIQTVDTDDIPRLQWGCRFTDSGEVYFELRKDLVASIPADANDSAYCMLDDAGELGLGMVLSPGAACTGPVTDLGLFLQFNDTGAGYYDTATNASVVPAPAPFVWPHGATMREGDVGHIADGRMADEMERWGVVGLALNRSVAPSAPDLYRGSMLAQGAGVGGVGVLAMLGTSGSAELRAVDRSISYAAFGGLSLVFDAGGSDRYSGNSRTLAAADAGGIAIFVESGGNDNYAARNASLAWAPAPAGTNLGHAYFFDLGGDDKYAYTPNATLFDQARNVVAEEASDVTVTPRPHLNNVVWMRPGSPPTGVGADYEITERARDIAGQQIVSQLYNATSTVLTFTAFDPNGPGKYGNKCTDRPLPTSASSFGIPVASEKVCFVARVVTGNGTIPRAAGNPALLHMENSTNGTIEVASVDFVVDRARIVTATDHVRLSPTVSEWSAVVDLSEFRDGIARAKALPTFEAYVAGRGVYLFSDTTTNSIVDSAATKSLYVNNAPGIAFQLDPDYTGRANATYSPFAYGDAQQLYTNYTVTPDAAEFRYAAANGWRTPLHNTSFPCQGLPPPDATPPLCSILPFYLPRGDTETLRTEPGTFAERDPRTLKTESLNGAPYSRQTDPLNTHLRIARDGAFHLALPNRASLLPILELTTHVKLQLVKESTKEVVKHPNGSIYYLANLQRSAAPEQAGLNSVGDLFFLFKDTYDNTTRDVDREIAQRTTGNIVWNQFNATYNANTTPGLRAIVNGTWKGYGGPDFKACEAQGPTQSQNAPNFALYTAFMLANNAIKTATDGLSNDTSRPDHILEDFHFCRDQKNVLDRAGNYSSGIPGLGGGSQSVANLSAPATEFVARTLAEATGNRSDGQRNTTLDFQDFFFDVEPMTPPRADFAADGFVWSSPDEFVVPPGYRLQLEFNYRPPVPLISADTREQTEQILALMTEIEEAMWGSGVNQPINGVNLSREIFHNQGVRGRVANETPRLLSQAAAGSNVPAGYFFVGGGAPDRQPRLAIKTIAEPSTSVTIRLDDPFLPEGEQTVAIIRDGRTVSGDIAGTPTRDAGRELFKDERAWLALANDSRDPVYAWGIGTAPRWTQEEVRYSDTGELEGLYLVNVTARDASGRESHLTQSVLIDRTAPRSTVSTLEYAGKAYVTNSKLPMRWTVDELGSGVREVYALYRLDPEGDITNLSTWRPLFPAATAFGAPISAAVRGGSVTVQADTERVLMMTIAVDRASNVEGVLGDGTEAYANESLALQAAFDAKLAAGANRPGGYRLVQIDLSAPLVALPIIEGGRILNHEGNDYTFLRAGEPAAFGICVRDEGTGIASVRLMLDNYGAGSDTLRSGVVEATRRGTCADGKERYVADTWHLVNTNATQFPSGIWQAEFEVSDRAGNKFPVAVGAIILDHDAPRVRVEPVVLPAGQTAVKLGDAVKIRFLADDPFGVDDDAIRVDASALARGAEALRTVPVRVNGVAYREASFTVDRTDAKDGKANVTLLVPDLAGNVARTQVGLAVDLKKFEFVPGTLRATNVTHNSLVLRWETTEPTSAFAEFGTTPVLLNGRTPQNLTATKEHALLVTNLSPSTSYFLRAVSVSPGGLVEKSEVIPIETSTALFLSPVSPKAGDRVSGLVEVRFEGGLRDSTDFVTFTLEVRESPQKPWTFVTTATRQGDMHTLRWNSTRFLDGTGYELRLSAQAGRDLTAKTIGGLTSDNTPPSVLVLSPLLATNDTTPSILAEASDSLSGLGTGAVQLLIDGNPVEGDVVVETTSNGRIRITHDIENALEAGLRLFELRVTDRAGVVAREAWRVAIDGDAPVVTVNPTRFSPGTAAAKLGGTVTLNLTIKDLSGVSLVAATTSGISSQPETRLVKLVNSDTWQGTFPVTAADASATRSVPVRVVDLAGNTADVLVDVAVDNVAPAVQATSLAETAHTKVVIDVPANEPILVNGTATAPRSPAVTAATSEAATTARLTFAGLLPSRTYQYKLTAMDRAGNPVDLQGTFATLQDTLPPTRVGAVSVVDLLNGTLRLTWSPADDDVAVSHYRLYRSADGVTFEAIGETETLEYLDSGLAYEKTYVYKVAAIDFGGNEGPADERLTVTVTAVPSITLGAVTPTVGSASTTFRYTITYTHPGGRAPAYVRIILDGVPQNMTLASGDALTGATYVYETRLAPHTRDAPHTYAFEASDGRYTVSFPKDGDVLRGPLVSGDALAEGPLEGFAAFAQRVPLGGAALLLVGIAAALGIAAAVGRRNKKGGSK